MKRVAILVVGAFACGGCMGAEALPADDVEPSIWAATLSPTDVAAVLALVNYPGTDATVLHTAAGVDSRAANRIAAHRDGADGRSPTDDDVLFGDLAELDAVPYVGDVAIEKLRTYALAHPAPAAETVSGVRFEGWESEAVVWGVNHGDVGALDALMDGRAASGLVSRRPFATVTAIDAVSYVGVSTLMTLHAHAATWWGIEHGGAPVLAGTFDGVAFDEATAHIAIDIANRATRDQLVAHGVRMTYADRIKTGRPYTTLSGVAAVSGIGAVALRELHGFAASGKWVVAPAYVLDSTTLTSITDGIKASLWDDEGFATVVSGLAGGDDTTASAIMSALEAEVDRLAAPLAGTSYVSADAAADAVVAATPVKARTRAGGWSYLATLGLTR